MRAGILSGNRGLCIKKVIHGQDLLAGKLIEGREKMLIR